MKAHPVKYWYHSKTVWANLLTLALASFSVAIESQLIDRETIVLLTGCVLPCLNLVLRWLTDEPISSPIMQLDGIRKAVKPNPSKHRIGKSNHRLMG